MEFSSASLYFREGDKPLNPCELLHHLSCVQGPGNRTGERGALRTPRRDRSLSRKEKRGVTPVSSCVLFTRHDLSLPRSKRHIQNLPCYSCRIHSLKRKCFKNMIRVCFEVFSSPLGCNFPMGRD